MASIYRKQRGQVLWGLLVMLTMMTELAISSLQMAAHEGLSVRVMEQRFQQRQWLELLAQQLERLPVPSRASAVSQQLWHPNQLIVKQGCGRYERAAITQSYRECFPADKPLLDAEHQAATWQWRLSQRPDVVAQVQEGSDLNAFPLLNAQMWQLELVSVGRAVASPRGLLLRYRQVAP